MARKSGDERSGQERRAAPRANRRTIKQEEDTSQSLERGQGSTPEQRIGAKVNRPRDVNDGSGEDTPSTGDWQRHSTGASSAARGKEGLGTPGENTWGGEQFRAERREEQGRRQTNSGPRSRRKPDESLRQEIREILIADPELEATDIEVEVEGGAVTLRGAVVDSDARLLAEELVESLTGVREVHNRLRVEREED